MRAETSSASFDGEKRTEEALRQRERQLALVVDTAPVFIAHCDRDCRFQFVNRAYAERFGLAQGDVVGRHLSEVIGPSAYEAVRPQIEEVLAGRSVAFETDVDLPGLGRRHMHARYAPEVDGQGEVHGFIAVVNDFTERKQAEEALRQSEARMAVVVESMPVGVGVTDTEGRTLAMNPAGLALHGFSSIDEMLAELDDYRHAFELHYPDGRPMPVEAWPASRTLRGETVRDYEVCLRRVSDGSERIASYTVVPVQDGEHTRYVYVMLDVTERKRAEQALRESEARFRALADNMSQFAWMADETGWIFWYNQRWYDFTGTTFEQMQGWGWRQIHHPDHVERVTAKFRHHIEAGEAWEDTFPLRGADGCYRWFLSRALPIRDEDGRILRWFGTNTDITERLQMEERLRASETALREFNQTLEKRVAARTEELAARNTELQQFAFVASHDLQEPLRKVQAFASMIRDEYGDRLDETGRFYLTRVQDAGARMSQLLADLLSYSRISTRGKPFRPVDVGKVLREVLGDIDLVIARTDAQVDVEADVVLEADAEQLRQLLNHLFLNALKFHREDVRPHLRVTAEVLEATPEAAPTCRIVVEDNGIGFDEKYAERIFQPFERLHGRSVYEGTGMGLAICRRIAERHGGTITAESTPGAGSRFVVSLPLHQGQAAPPA